MLPQKFYAVASFYWKLHVV